MEIYEGKCAITWCNVVDVLEAAHFCLTGILYDEGLLAVDPGNLSVQLSPSIRENEH